MAFILSHFCYLQNGNKSFVSVSDWQMRSLTGTFVFLNHEIRRYVQTFDW